MVWIFPDSWRAGQIWPTLRLRAALSGLALALVCGCVSAGNGPVLLSEVAEAPPTPIAPSNLEGDGKTGVPVALAGDAGDQSTLAHLAAIEEIRAKSKANLGNEYPTIADEPVAATNQMTASQTSASIAELTSARADGASNFQDQEIANAQASAAEMRRLAKTHAGDTLRKIQN